ncbi:ferrochelatase [Frankia sp. CcI49]|uniref:ferrochelatase n=1 Tax=unclassified Frankia TaxID=2632575 RepID=UPI0006CA377F|nr:MULTISPECIES: ferrochelatase [unclassified Frankia]KPM54977.1 ferrochelatase [Frankia sp. R43]ONH56130.1 ferrochelatase [Frankia sp. CcI49]
MTNGAGADRAGADRGGPGGLDVDALLLVSFGGPEGPDDVMPFLRNVTRGRAVPELRLAEVAAHYDHFDGRSPINDQNRALLAALRERLAPLPVYWGNRNWAPYLADAVARMRADGVRRAACFVTAAFASYSGCRQYREDLAEALRQVGPGAPDLVKLRLFFDHPGFVEPMVDHCVRAVGSLPAEVRDGARLVFTAHALPLEQAVVSGPDGGAYERQLRATAEVIAARVGARLGRSHPWQLAFCSRSGPPGAPWLEPDINDALAVLAEDGEQAAVIVPVGFVSDHMEVVYDLDVEAVRTAGEHGIAVARAGTVGTDPRFVDMVADLLAERRHPDWDRPALSEEGPAHDVCPLHCCDPAGPLAFWARTGVNGSRAVMTGGAGTRAHGRPGVRRPAAAGVPADLCGRGHGRPGLSGPGPCGQPNDPGPADGRPGDEATILVEERASVARPDSPPAGE